MRVHVVTHVPFEGPGAIASWAQQRGHEIVGIQSITERYPEPHAAEFVVIMGGPMDADDEVASPWLVAEKRFLRESIACGGSVVGVCLGAQILAEVLGGQVKRNPRKEIGWYEVRLTETGRGEPLLGSWPQSFVCAHWHGDTFDLPPGCVTLAESDACANQLFVAADGRAVGMQFHLEWDGPSLSVLASECEDELAAPSESVMSAAELLEGASIHADRCHELLFALLDGVLDGRAGVQSERA